MLLAGEFSQFEELIAARFPCRRTFRRGDTVIGLMDDRSKNCYFVLEGLVSFEMLNVDGRSHISTMRGEGTIFPLYYSYEATSVERTLEVRALRDTKLVVMSKQGLRALMLEEPSVAIAMLDAYGKYLTYVNYEVEAQMFESVEKRVSNFLYLHRDKDDVVHATHAEIAEAAGTTRANATRAISALRNAGIVSSKRGNVMVISPHELLERCSFVAGLE